MSIHYIERARKIVFVFVLLLELIVKLLLTSNSQFCRKLKNKLILENSKLTYTLLQCLPLVNNPQLNLNSTRILVQKEVVDEIPIKKEVVGDYVKYHLTLELVHSVSWGHSIRTSLFSQNLSVHRCYLKQIATTTNISCHRIIGYLKSN